MASTLPQVNEQANGSLACRFEVRSQFVGRSYHRRKYFVDRILGLMLLILVSPLVLALFALVKLTSPGPGLYRQRRVGLHGKVFEIVKLRSMVQNAEKPGQAVWSPKNDTRVTWLGESCESPTSTSCRSCGTWFAAKCRSSDRVRNVPRFANRSTSGSMITTSASR